jgi:nucleoside 2-deoxyribosyltransferase
MASVTRLRIYLAGKIPKGSEIGNTEDWRRSFIEQLSSVGDFEFLSPEDPTLDERYPQQIFGHDCHLVQQCDILVINANTKLGAGTAQEMVIAKYFEKYVVTLLPRESHHRRADLNMHGVVVEDWIHPFVHEMSDYIADSFSEVQACLADNAASLLRRPPKTMKVVDDGIAAYINSGPGGVGGNECAGSGSDGFRQDIC